MVSHHKVEGHRLSPLQGIAQPAPHSNKKLHTNLSFSLPLLINPLQLLTYILKSLMVSLRSSKWPGSPLPSKKPSCKSGTANSKVPCTIFSCLFGCFWGFLVCGSFLSLLLKIWGFEFFCLVGFCLIFKFHTTTIKVVMQMQRYLAATLRMALKEVRVLQWPYLNKHFNL